METLNIKMHKYNGSDYDTLYPQTTIEQVVDLQDELDDKQDNLTDLSTFANDKYLHTNSSTGALEWSNVSGGLPSQTSHAGEYLTTDGTDASWASIPGSPTKISDLTDDTATYPIDKANTLTDLTATATELNVLDGITATTAELNYTDGVTSNIQTQLDAKSAKASLITGGTLDADNWVNNTQTLTFTPAGTLPISGYVYSLSPDSSDFINFSNAQIYADDVTTADTVVFHCVTTPTSDIDVIITKMEIA